MKLDIHKLSTKQLYAMDDALNEYIFKEIGEPFAPTYTKDPKHFKKILSMLGAYYSDLSTYFQGQYDIRYTLINYNNIDLPFNQAYWDTNTTDLAQVIEGHSAKFFDMGIAAFLLASTAAVSLHSTDPKAQKVITDTALVHAGDINTTTQKRVLAQIKTAIKLNENRDEFDQRLLRVFKNPYRGRFIAQNEGLQSYLDAKEMAASETNQRMKTWIGSQMNGREICGQVIGQTIPVNDTFSNGLDGPLAHLGCKCDLIYS